MIKPDYNGKSIVNLLSSIQKSFGAKNRYKQLRDLKLSKTKNILLMVIDGLGYEYLQHNKKKTFFEDKKIIRITSAFPTTTASCITTFMTGEAARQHGITGWFMHAKELGGIIKPLCSTFRSGDKTFSQLGLDPKKVYDQKSIFSKIDAESYVILEKSLLESDYNATLNKDAKILTYKEDDMGSFFKQARKAASGKKRRFIYAYWPYFDKTFHHKGEKSKELKKHFKAIDKEISSFAKSLEGTDTTLIITADHGLLDTKTILLDDHPILKNALSMPLCGEPRLAYCYVKPSKIKDFERYVKAKMSRYCTLHRSEELVRKNYYGLYASHKRLHERIGDYILVMKDDYAIKDFVTGEKRKIKKASHGGMSEKEMYVPLIILHV